MQRAVRLGEELRAEKDQPAASCARCDTKIASGDPERFCSLCATGEAYDGMKGDSRGNCKKCGDPIYGPIFCKAPHPKESEEARHSRHQRTARAVGREHGPVAARAYREALGLLPPSAAKLAPPATSPPSPTSRPKADQEPSPTVAYEKPPKVTSVTFSGYGRQIVEGARNAAEADTWKERLAMRYHSFSARLKDGRLIAVACFSPRSSHMVIAEEIAAFNAATVEGRAQQRAELDAEWKRIGAHLDAAALAAQ
jgi:hypothetical protein